MNHLLLLIQNGRACNAVATLFYFISCDGNAHWIEWTTEYVHVCMHVQSRNNCAYAYKYGHLLAFK